MGLLVGLFASHNEQLSRGSDFSRCLGTRSSEYVESKLGEERSMPWLLNAFFWGEGGAF